MDTCIGSAAAATEPVDVDAITVEPGTLLVGPFPDESVRRSTVDTQRATEPEDTSRPWWRGPLGAVAAIAAILALGAIGFVLASGEAEVATPTTSGAPPSLEAEAMAFVDQYFAAYAAGDVGAMLDVLTEDATIRGTSGSETRESWERLYTWKVAEGTVFTPRVCTAAQASPASVTVTCEYSHHQYPAILVGAPATPHRQTMIITPEGVTSLVVTSAGPPSGRLAESCHLGWPRIT